MKILSAGISQARMLVSRAHTHDHWEIVLNMEGAGVTIVDGERFPFSAGMIICHPPGVAHVKQSDQPWRDIFIQTNALFPHSEAATQASLIFHDDEDHSIETLMRLALRAFMRNEPLSHRLMGHIAETIYQLLQMQITRPVRHPEVERLENMLIEGFTDPEFTVSLALNRCAYNKDHLRRRFKAETGMTPLCYLTSLRLDYATQLLGESGTLRPVAEIAIMAGFYDPLYFSRVFRRRWGCAPSAYRQTQALL